MLILSASIGEGHDLPARFLRDGILTDQPGAQVVIRDGLQAMGGFVTRVVGQEAPLQNRRLAWVFDLEYRLLLRFRELAGRVGVFLAGRRLLRAIAAERPDVVVSTYPGVTEVLGRLRHARRLPVPVVSAITDLSALRFWAHPGVDLHLITHEESAAEVLAIAQGTRVVCVRGLTSPEFDEGRDEAAARRDLGLPPAGGVVLVSGGGWGVGDVEGAIQAALSVADVAAVVVLCGRNERLRERVERDYGEQPRVRALGFTDRMSDLVAAAGALVHSTAGLTVLEAWIRGCRPISYGWGVGHIRANNEAFARFGLADVVTSRGELPGAIARALAQPRRPAGSYRLRPSAASLVLDLARR